MNDPIRTRTISLIDAEKVLAEAETVLDYITIDILDREKHNAINLAEIERTIGDVNLALSDYLSAAVASDIATESYKSRASECETSYSVLARSNERKEKLSDIRER